MSDPARHRGDTRTWSRWRNLGLLVLVALMLGLDRAALVVLAPALQAELEFTTSQMAWLLATGFACMGLLLVPASGLLRVLAVATMLAVATLGCGAATGLMGLVICLTGSLLLRAAHGLGQAAARPTVAVLLTRWLPLSERERGQWVGALADRAGLPAGVLLAGGLLVALGPELDPTPELTPDDLLDPSGLAADLVDATAETPVARQHPLRGLYERVFWSFDPWTRARLRQWAVSGAPSQVDPVWLLELNGLLNRLDLIEPEFLDHLDLPAVADDLLARGLVNLEHDELRTFNRLVLEAALPGQIRSGVVGRWRPVLWILGGLVAVAGGLALLLLASRPQGQAGTNPAELAWISPPADDGCDVPARGPRGGRIVAFVVGQVGLGSGWGLLLTLSPFLLIERFGLEGFPLAVAVALPLILGLLGVVAARRQTATLGLQDWQAPSPRTLVVAVRAVAAVALLGLMLELPLIPTLALLGVVAAAGEYGNAEHWIDAHAVGTGWGRRLLIAGEAAFWLGCGLAPLVVWGLAANWLASESVSHWATGLALLAGGCLLSAVAATAWPQDGPWSE